MSHIEVTTRWMILVMCTVLCCTIISSSAFFYIHSNRAEFMNEPVLKSNSEGKVSIKILSNNNQVVSPAEPKNAQVSIKLINEQAR